MGDWLEYIRTFWPIGVAVSVLVAGILVLWLKSGFATRDGINKVHGRLDLLSDAKTSHAERIKHLEDAFGSAPTRHELQEDIAALSARMSAVEAGMGGIQNQLKTTNNYLHTLVENGLKGQRK
jgi:flagellin-like hook-associated protein FlgL